MKFDTNKPRAGLTIEGFSNALLAVAEVSTFGAQKYSPDSWKRITDGIPRYTDALYRHLLAGVEETHDEESGLLHAAHAAWNALAILELKIKQQNK